MRFSSHLVARLVGAAAIVALASSTAQAQWSYKIYDGVVDAGDGRPYGPLMCSGTTLAGTEQVIDYMDDDAWFALCPTLDGAHISGTGASRFGAIFSTIFTVTTAGPYTFALASDDGSTLYIDDIFTIDLTGDHSYFADSATPTLTAGDHRIDVYYFEWEFKEHLTATLDPRLFGTPPGAAVVPEPATWMLLATGLAVVGGIRVRARRRRAPI